MLARRLGSRPAWGLLLIAPLIGCGCSLSKAPPAEMPVHQAARQAPPPAAMSMPGADSASMASAAQGGAPAPTAAIQGGAAAPNPAPAAIAPAKASATTPPRDHARGAKEVPSDKGEAAHMIIFTGGLDLEVEGEDFGKSLHEVVDIAVAHGGYIGEQSDQSVTVRVPSPHFRETLREIEKLGRVIHRSVRAEDVSEQFHDADVRLRNLLATRKRIEGFLDRAKDINEVLRIEQELARLNTEIDALQGRLRFLSARAAFSTITINLRAKPKPVVVAEPAEEPPPPPPPPPPRTLDLPIDWLSEVSLDGLLRLENE